MGSAQSMRLFDKSMTHFNKSMMQCSILVPISRRGLLFVWWARRDRFQVGGSSGN
jgi:hypothetical protein